MINFGKKHNLLFSGFCLLVFFFSLVPVVSANAQGIVREISVSGTKRVDPATVINYLGVSVGDYVTEDDLNESMKNLFATGLFADVSIEHRNGFLRVNVKENRIINKIAFEGNRQIKDEELEREIFLRPRQALTRTRVQKDVERIYELYKRSGRFAVRVEPKIIELEQNRVNLVFEISEGEVTKIKKITFVGNKAFSDARLEDEISSKEKRWYRFITTDDRYDPDRVEYDKELLRRFYLREGYADFRVISADVELSDDGKDFFLSFTVDEGERYSVGKVAINSRLRGFDGAQLKDSLTFVPGQWYDADELRASVDNMVDYLGDRQYAFVDIRPRVERNRDSHTVDIVFDVAESPRVFVEKINIHGNLRTVDKVIRREILLVEGDPFSRSALAKSERRIRDLGFFENVKISTLAGSAPDKTVIDVEVSEKSTGELSIGAGFSTSEGPLADLRLRERNLLGRGQDLLFATTVAGNRTQFDVSFTEPYFLDRDISAGFDAFHTIRDLHDESSYDQKMSGGALRIGYPLSEKWRQSWSYRYEHNKVTNVNSDASRYIREQEGTRNTSSISQRLTYDDRDSKLFPTEGLYSWLDVEGAGIGGDAKYVSGKLGSSYYLPLYKRSVILNLLGEVGAIEGLSNEDVRINDRYYIGGSTLRGFKSAGIGPRDKESGDALGGNVFYRGTVELSFPLGVAEEMGILGHAFTDFGSLWDIDENGSGFYDESSVRAAAGLGISWRSPMGPIRADFSVPYADESFDKTEKFRFSFGTRF